MSKRKEQYDHHTAAAIATTPTELKRALRKLVREALNHPDAMKRGENVADRIAKELVP